jgi:hypothetical protein
VNDSAVILFLLGSFLVALAGVFHELGKLMRRGQR